MKASGFPTVRFRRRAQAVNIWDYSTHTTHADAARLAVDLSRRELTAGPGQRSAAFVLLGRSFAARIGPPAADSSSICRSDIDPDTAEERSGPVANVVFPTDIDRRDDLGLPDRFDICYGMADSRIGAARLDLPDCPPSASIAAQARGKI